jgi:hypothetical protein
MCTDVFVQEKENMLLYTGNLMWGKTAGHRNAH